jgi:hypothetical protein
MTEDLRRRLEDLTTTAADLAALLTGNAAGGLPGLLVARCAVAVDRAAAALERHRDALQQARPTSPKD